MDMSSAEQHHRPQKRAHTEPRNAASSTFKRQESNTICYGCLCSVKTQLSRSYQSFINMLTPQDYIDVDILSFQVALSEQTLVLQSYQGISMGCLNVKASTVLSNLMEYFEVSLNAVVKLAAVSESHKVAEPHHKLAVFPSEVNLYGPLDMGKIIGNDLSRHRLFLQHPSFRPAHMNYVNPQEIRFSSRVTERVAIDSLEPWSNFDPNTSSDLNFVVDNLLQQEQMETISASSLEEILTALYDHQWIGVSFMLTRERGPLVPPHCLWKLQYTTGGEAYHRHLITDETKKGIPNEAQGGLIADEMGLGKTLMVLATVVESCIDARRFGADAERRSNVKSTLIVVSNALILNVWIQEIAKHVRAGALAVHKHHGQYKDIDLVTLRRFDIVVTTYDTVAYDFHRGRRFLQSANWYRVVLDEAHAIRTRSTRKFQAVHSLSAKYRWCLTGTPIQNLIEDVGSLMRFLRVPLFEDPRIFRDYIVTPINSKRSNLTPQERFKNLRKLLGAICIRRTKESLPDFLKPLIEEREAKFSHVEEIEQKKIMTRFDAERTKSLFGNGVQVRRGNRAREFLCLRMFCNTGTLTPPGGLIQDEQNQDEHELLSLLELEGEAHCKMCLTEITSIGTDIENHIGRFYSCRHLMCRACTSEMEELGEEKLNEADQVCAVCESNDGMSNAGKTIPVTKGQDPASKGGVVSSPGSVLTSGHSSKLNLLMEELKSSPKDTRSLVFSFWKTTLDLVARMLDDCSMSYRRVHGEMSISERQEALKAFEDIDHAPILLMTIGCGAEGLNVPTANTIHILEPQWNPATERQAIGRAVRLGQKQQVKVIRYTVKGSIEDHVKRIQIRKIRQAGGAFAADSAAYLEEALLQYTKDVCPELVQDEQF